MAKQFPQSLQTHLDSGTTTLAWCWRLTRNDGTVFGFAGIAKKISSAAVRIIDLIDAVSLPWAEQEAAVFETG